MVSDLARSDCQTWLVRLPSSAESWQYSTVLYIPYLYSTVLYEYGPGDYTILYCRIYQTIICSHVGTYCYIR